MKVGDIGDKMSRSLRAILWRDLDPETNTGDDEHGSSHPPSTPYVYIHALVVNL